MQIHLFVAVTHFPCRDYAIVLIAWYLIIETHLMMQGDLEE